MTIPDYIQEVAERLCFGPSCKPSAGVWCVYRQSWTGVVRVGYVEEVSNGRVWGVFRNADDMRITSLHLSKDVEGGRSYIFWPEPEAFFFEDTEAETEAKGPILQVKCFSQFQQKILQVYT